MIQRTTPIAETNHFIVLETYIKREQPNEGYQTEAQLENECISDLINQGYEYRSDLTCSENLYRNVREQIQRLNQINFSDAEWERFKLEYLDKPGETTLDKTDKVHNDDIKDFVFDNGEFKNLYLFDKYNIHNNKVQVVNQVNQRGRYKNRYDITILVNGLPMVQIELKKRGIPIREAFHQIHRYQKESFNEAHSLFQYIQVFVISNGTDTRYFANTTQRSKNSFDFTINWALADNTPIHDLKDFTATFLQKRTLLKVLFDYAVFDVNRILLLMRPYQIAATERILWRIACTHNSPSYWNKPEGGGYIWHTTGTGKTLTSFKTARLAKELPYIDKVFFVVDRKDLDYQTINEYERFSPGCVNATNNTQDLENKLAQQDNKIIVTTIQKLNRLIKSRNSLSVYSQAVVFIFDECHRSQFGEAQRNIRRKFKKYCQFGFTGTPIFSENALYDITTSQVFGQQLHAYIITDAIRDEKVLKFKVDYNDVRPQFKQYETEKNLNKLTAFETQQALLHPERIREITRYILEKFPQKTHRLNATGKGFNAMFAVSSIQAAKLYYQQFKQLQQNVENPLKVATIFSFAPNEPQYAQGDIIDETWEADDIEHMESSSKEFLESVIKDYNELFGTTYALSGDGFQNYYQSLARKVQEQEVDLLIVVGMFLTGFDAPQLNTLFVDKLLRYHGLIQAFSRTNRIYDATKSFGNIVTFRDLEQETIEAIKLFGHDNTRHVILERSFKDYMEGYTDDTGKTEQGYLEIVKTLKERFPDPTNIYSEKDKKEFVRLFGDYLKIENKLQNYDEFAEFQAQCQQGNQGVSEPQSTYTTADDETIYVYGVPSMRDLQDYRSTYHDMNEWVHRMRNEEGRNENREIDWSDVVFEVELLKSLEINLDYILGLIFESYKKNKDKSAIIDEIRRVVRSSYEHREREPLIVEFINQADLNAMPQRETVIEQFYRFSQKDFEQNKENIIDDENLDPKKTEQFLNVSLKNGYVNENGTDLEDLLPKDLHQEGSTSLNFKLAKKRVLKKMSSLVTKFKGIVRVRVGKK